MVAFRTHISYISTSLSEVHDGVASGDQEILEVLKAPAIISALDQRSGVKSRESTRDLNFCASPPGRRLTQPRGVRCALNEGVSHKIRGWHSVGRRVRCFKWTRQLFPHP